jgi:tetratricopeptide (TPR) repeat protein
MRDGTLCISGKNRILTLYVVFAALIVLSIISGSTLLGAYYYGKVPGILDDRSSEERVAIQELSAETVPAYRNAIESLERAVFVDPSNALYRKALAGMYLQLGTWAEAMELLKAPLPEGAFLPAAAIAHATTNIHEAVRRQPTNPDNHLAYGRLARETKHIDTARSEYTKAVVTFPKSSALRYSVAMEYLAAGMQAEALAQAKELARIDDSYKMPESVAIQQAMERRTPFYINRLTSSYLFKALEIIWRMSNKDINMMRSSVPDNDEARDAFELFVELKGVRDN